MRYWRVTIDCYQRVKPRSQSLTRSRRHIIVHAEDDEDAFAIAKKHAQSTAPMGPKWVAFEVREAATVTLPFCYMTVKAS